MRGYISLLLFIGLAWGQDCTADDGTEGVELWGECYSIDNTTQLDLGNNQLTGVIPPEIGNLTNLTDLYLEWNQLTGSIPPEIGNLTNLTYLYLNNNQLTGSIPPEIGNLTNLIHLFLYNNQLTGSIPPEIGNLTNLTYLVLSDNELTGSIPSEIWNLTNLTDLVLSTNELTGSIPSEIGSLINLSHLNLEDNLLTGEIPESICDLNINWDGWAFNIPNNQFCPPYPSCIEDYVGVQDTSNCELPYTGPVWHVAGFGSDSLGNGSYDSPFGSIQKAIDISENGDTVRVSSGTYIGNINFYGKDIVVEGEGPETTIIDGNGGTENVVRFFGFETAAAQLRGFTITNGAAASGAGIYCNNANPTIEHVLITNNSGSSGAGLYCLGSSPTLKNVTITLNSASLNGGAIYTRGASSSPTLVDCILFTNSPEEIYISEGNVSATYSDIQGGWDGVGNINAWPLFCDSDNGASYKLAENSACAGSGQGGNYMGAFPVGCAAILSTQADILPKEYTLHQNYPNPFNPVTSLRYDLPEDGLVNITIYDMMGRIVKTLVNSSQTAGYKSIKWNATNNRNEPVSAGLYLYSIQAGEFRQTKKMVLLK